MQIQDAAESVQRAASAATNGGAAVAAGTAATGAVAAVAIGPTAPVAKFLGLTLMQWQGLGVLSGVLIGLAGLAVNWYYTRKRLQLDLARAKDAA